LRVTGLTGWQQVAAEGQPSDDSVAPSSESSTSPAADRAVQEETAALKQQASELFRSLQNIQDRLAELEDASERRQANRPAEPPAQ
jgi:hypothetical protein